MHKRVINVFHARVRWTHVCGLRYFSEVCGNFYFNNLFVSFSKKNIHFLIQVSRFFETILVSNYLKSK